jgi:hypothetical protein
MNIKLRTIFIGNWIENICRFLEGACMKVNISDLLESQFNQLFSKLRDEFTVHKILLNDEKSLKMS